MTLLTDLLLGRKPANFEICLCSIGASFSLASYGTLGRWVNFADSFSSAVVCRKQWCMLVSIVKVNVKMQRIYAVSDAWSMHLSDYHHRDVRVEILPGKYWAHCRAAVTVVVVVWSTVHMWMFELYLLSSQRGRESHRSKVTCQTTADHRPLTKVTVISSRGLDWNKLLLETGGCSVDTLSVMHLSLRAQRLLTT